MPMSRLREVEDALSGASYGIFTFRDRTFIDLYWFFSPEYPFFDNDQKGRVHVFKTEGGASEEICTARVRPAVIEACDWPTTSATSE